MALLLKALAFAGILTLPATVAVAEKAPCVMASSEERAEMIDEINAQRARAGLSQLKENRGLTIAAQQHACDMQWSNFSVTSAPMALTSCSAQRVRNTIHVSLQKILHMGHTPSKVSLMPSITRRDIKQIS